MKRSRAKLVAAAGIFLVGMVPAVAAHAVAPDNDLIENATLIGSLPYAETIDTTDAHADGPRACGNSGSVFYRFKPSADTRVQVDTLGSDYDTTLQVFRGPRRHLENLVCRDDSGFGLQTSARFNAHAGQRYLIVAGLCCGDGRDGGGQLTIRVQEVPLAPLTVDLVLTGGTIDAISGELSLEGTLDCSNAADVDLFALVRQRHGDFVASAVNDTTIHCDGSGVAPWAVGEWVSDVGISYVAGDARVRFDVFAFDGEFHEVAVEQSQVIPLVVV